MATTPNDPLREDRHQVIRLYLFMLTMLIGLVIVAGTVYLSYQHPRLATPIQTGGTTAAVLVAAVAVVIRRR
ncbi:MULTISPECIES: hypothetical protein [unclassified Streptomyces]|uniref:hypothetical protein n=1 Tax=unclassified Streptomyces TaxID=2593676 RepID=UPI000CD4D8C2|nr:MULTISPECIES: hypothetical protein [unclassified Streptomyces]